MKILFTSSRPIRNTAGLKNLKQPAQQWLAALIESLGDQLKDDGDRRIVMECGGFQIAFTLERIPKVLEIARITLKGGSCE